MPSNKLSGKASSVIVGAMANVKVTEAVPFSDEAIKLKLEVLFILKSKS